MGTNVTAALGAFTPIWVFVDALWHSIYELLGDVQIEEWI